MKSITVIKNSLGKRRYEGSSIVVCALFLALGTSCQQEKVLKPADSGHDLPLVSIFEVDYKSKQTDLRLWAPTAEMVNLYVYNRAEGGTPTDTFKLQKYDEEKLQGVWQKTIKGDMDGKFYTFSVKHNGKWLHETPGTFVKCVGVNGLRGAIVDPAKTVPEGWYEDVRPQVGEWKDAIIYELHLRDFSMSPTSGINHKGKYLSLTEKGTKTPQGLASGIDHLKELGVTHVMLMPVCDFARVDESKPDVPQYSWGYDPVNFTVPEGSYATDAFQPEVRNYELREMVMALHQAGIRVVLDFPFNHTYSYENSAFELTVPNYFYRRKRDGALSNGSTKGNETDTEQHMMRNYMIQVVNYWVYQYHIDGIHINMMSLADVKTMGMMRQELDKIDPSLILFGEGWAHVDSERLKGYNAATKENMPKLPGISCYSDEFRDGLRGPHEEKRQGGFLMGQAPEVESIKFGIVGGINHPQLNLQKINHSIKPWALEPSQLINYVSNHDDFTMADRFRTIEPGVSDEKILRLNKLGQTMVMTSQGLPLMLSGEELMRDRKGAIDVEYGPDEVNELDWSNKAKGDLFGYYKNLIHLRKNHPAFHMGTAEMVNQNLKFIDSDEKNFVAYILENHAGGDTWNNIFVAFNGNSTPVTVALPTQLKNKALKVVCRDGKINEAGLDNFSGETVIVKPQEALIMCETD